MDRQKRIALLNELIDEARALHPDNIPAAEKLRSRTLMILRNLYEGARKPYEANVMNVRFGGTRSHLDSQAFLEARERLAVILETAREEEVRFSPDEQQGEQQNGHEPQPSKRVFLVHGHDNEMKQAVARALERLGLTVVILHEQPDEGRTVIEKFSDFADVGFAVVLLSPDDVGSPADADPTEGRPRARQNVIFELGYFIGGLGRARVLALYREVDDFEFPSDYEGVLFKPYDSANAWQFELVKELLAAGIEVDANNLLRGKR